MLLGAGTWLALGAQLLDMLVTGVDPSPYNLAQGALVVVGLAGGAAWLGSWRRWRALLAMASAACLVLFLVRLFVLYTWKFLETDPLHVALWNTFVWQWMVIVHFMAEGWFAAGVLLLFYEWLMPLALAIVLGWLIITRSKEIRTK